MNSAEQTQVSLRTVISERPVPELPVLLHENPLVHRLLAARGVETPEELHFSLASLPRPDSLMGIKAAVARLMQARAQQERVLILGDYDCDGATSTSVALSGLRMLGFRQLDYLIPSRSKFGYGLAPAIVEVAKQRFQPQLIVTVDNGVASVEGVERARELGIDVLVTDHHLAPSVLPRACAIINPTIPGSTFPAQNLAGVGVIFYTLLALRAHLAALDDQHGKAPLAQLLDLVAIGTVADVVPLDRTNRILVEQGLRRIRAGQTRPGVLALLQSAGRSAQSVATEDIGFGIGPRLNAAGRIDDMSRGVQCLLSDNAAQATQLAANLDELNKQRRSIERDMHDSADQQLQKLDLDTFDGNRTLSVCLMDESWHEGVIGILAGRIKERLHRPTLIFTASDEHNLKGSARSIKGIHIRDVLQTIVTRHPGMIEKFGGHAMAAGLTLPRKHFDTFTIAFEEAVSEAAGGYAKEREYLTDCALAAHERHLDNARLLNNLMPWGQEFEAPLFVGEFLVSQHKQVGKGHLKMTLGCPETSEQYNAIAFNCQQSVSQGELIRIVYALQVNTWRDQQTLQLMIRHLEPAGLR